MSSIDYPLRSYPCKPLNQFDQFSNLPKKLRCRIWKLALPDPRSYIVNFYGPNDETYELQDWTPPPACLMVNQEARREALRYLKKIPLFHGDYNRESDSESSDDSRASDDQLSNYASDEERRIAKKKWRINDKCDKKDKKRRRTKESYENWNADKKRRIISTESDAAYQRKYLDRDVPSWKHFVYINFEIDWIYIMRETEHYLSRRPYAIWEWSERVENLGIDWRVWKAVEDPVECTKYTFPAAKNVCIIGEDTSKLFPLKIQRLGYTASKKKHSGWMLENLFIHDTMTGVENEILPAQKLDLTVVEMPVVVDRGRKQRRALHLRLK